MAAIRVKSADGLNTSDNVLNLPEGTLAIADNCVINNANVVEPRRGFEYLGYTFGTTPDRASQTFVYRGTLLVQYGTKLAYDSGVAFIEYSGTNGPPDAAVLRMQGAESAQNFYFTTSEGVKGIDGPTENPFASGLPTASPPTRRIIPTAKTGNPNSGTALPTNVQVGYVQCYGRRDVNGTVTLGMMSEPVYIQNPEDFTVAAGQLTNPAFGQRRMRVPAVDAPKAYGYQVGDIVYVDCADANYGTGNRTLTAAYLDLSTLEYVLEWLQPGTGLPASTTTATATSGVKDVVLRAAVNPEMTTDNFVQIYRTYNSAGNNVLPRPNYYLMIERQLTSFDISNGYFQYTDTTPESLLQDPAPWNVDDGEPADGSPDNDNSRAPYCTDLAFWDNRLWGANYQERQNLTIFLLGTGSPSGLQVGDTITVAGITYTGIAEGLSPTSTQFIVYDSSVSGTPSQQVQATAQGLAQAITQNLSSTVNAYYTSGVEDIPGKIFLEARTASASSFTVYASRVSAWNPELTTSSSGALTSSADSATNAVWFSKKEQPEAVPRLNRIQVGPKNGRILRILPLRERLFVFTDIAGIYSISGSYPYRVDELTKTTTLLAPDSLRQFDDALWGLTSQGVVRINESGPSVMSLAIEVDIKELFGDALSVLKTKAYGISYESYRKYLLAMPTVIGDTENTQVFVYDVATKAWTRWTKPIRCGVVNPQSDVLYVAQGAANRVSKERKTFTRADYSDESFTVTIASFSGKAVTVNSTTGISVGDVLYQSNIAQAVVTAITSSTVLQTDQSVTWGLTTATVYTAIENKLVWTPQFADAASDWKNFRELVLHFRTPAFSLGKAITQADTNPAEILQDMAAGGFGIPPWAAFAWAQPGGAKNKRTWVPAEHCRTSYLSVGFYLKEARTQWALNGYTLVVEGGSEREQF